MPENTLLAFESAQQQEVGIELDVMTTKDGKVVVHHDFKTGRTFQLPGEQKQVGRTNWQELQKARFNFTEYQQAMQRVMGQAVHCKNTDRFENLQIPELETVLNRLPNTPVYIELKTAGLFGNRHLERKVVDTIREKGLQNQVTVLSFSPLSLWKVKRQDPQIQTALNVLLPGFVPRVPLLQKLFVNWFAKRLLGVDAIHPSYARTTPELVQLSHQAGLRVVPWVHGETRDQEQEKFPKLRAMGVDGLITNAVDLLNEEVKNHP